MIINLDTKGLILEYRNEFSDVYLKMIENVFFDGSEKIIYCYKNKIITFLIKNSNKFSFFFYYFPEDLKFNQRLVADLDKEDIKLCHSVKMNASYLAQEFVSNIGGKKENMLIRTLPIELVFNKMKLIVKKYKNEYSNF